MDDFKKLFFELKVIDAAIFLAITSAYLYFVTFIYEQAYCSHFDIPASFIVIGIDTILSFCSTIAALVFKVAFPIITCWIFFRKNIKKSSTKKSFFVLNMFI